MVSTLPYMEQESYSPPISTYGPPTCMIWWSPYLIWNTYHMVPHMYIWSPHMYDIIFQASFKRGPLYVLTIPPTCMIWLESTAGNLWLSMWSVFMIRVHCGNLVAVNDSDGPPYLIWTRYLMVPLTLYGTHIIWAPHVYMVPSTCMIWWSLLTLYGTGIIWLPHITNGPPTCMIWFFGQASKEVHCMS